MIPLGRTTFISVQNKRAGLLDKNYQEFQESNNRDPIECGVCINSGLERLHRSHTHKASLASGTGTVWSFVEL